MGQGSPRFRGANPLNESGNGRPPPPKRRARGFLAPEALARPQALTYPRAIPPRRERNWRRTMLKFYYNGSPNPTKVALFLEAAGLAYEAIPIDTRKGDQFKPE